MLATVGWVWTATGTHFEGMLSTSKGISFADCAAAANPILAAAKVPGAGIWQMIFAIGALEVYWEKKYPSYECAGNFGVPAVTEDPAKLKELQTMAEVDIACAERAAADHDAPARGGRERRLALAASVLPRGRGLVQRARRAPQSRQ